MTITLYSNFYYRYRQKRKSCKSLVDNLNYQQAKTNLETSIAEHESVYTDSNTRRDFNFGEKIMMQHALNHLNTVIDDNDPEILDSDTGQIFHHSDTVKLALDRIPKSNYQRIPE